MPIKEVNGAMVYLRDVAQVRDGAGVQTNIVRVNGHRGVYLTILRNGKASSLAIVNRVKAMLPQITRTLPDDVKLQLLLDQSLFVRASINGVIREAIIAACLTALMILLFLGSWHSTFIVATSIPLAILSSIIALWATGQTLNVMTLGGLALAVGILVDDATVEIENINRNMAEGKEILSRDHGRCGADRHAHVRVHTRDLHRVRPDLLPVGTGRGTLPAARHGRRLRGAGLLSAVAYRGPDHGALPPCGRRASHRRGGRRPAGAGARAGAPRTDQHAIRGGLSSLPRVL